MAPVSIKVYDNCVASRLASVLFPQEEKPSIAMIIFLVDMQIVITTNVKECIDIWKVGFIGWGWGRGWGWGGINE